MGFLLVIIELFSLDITCEVLWEKIDRKLAISLQRGQFDPKFPVEGDVPTNNFCNNNFCNKCPTSLSLTVFTQRNFIADFLQEKCDFRGKTAVLRFYSASALLAMQSAVLARGILSVRPSRSDIVSR